MCARVFFTDIFPMRFMYSMESATFVPDITTRVVFPVQLTAQLSRSVAQM